MHGFVAAGRDFRAPRRTPLKITTSPRPRHDSFAIMAGVSEPTFSSNFAGDAQIREVLATEVFRDRGVAAPRAAFYRVMVDRGAGPAPTGPRSRRMASRRRPTRSRRTSVTSRRPSPRGTRRRAMPHNYYLYGDPAQKGRLRWIPRDNNMSFGVGPGGGGRGRPGGPPFGGPDGPSPTRSWDRKASRAPERQLACRSASSSRSTVRPGSRPPSSGGLRTFRPQHGSAGGGGIGEW